MRRILVTGALGQIGVELVPALRKHYGADRVVASDLRAVTSRSFTAGGDYERLDCMQPSQIFEVMRRRDIGVVYHLAALPLRGRRETTARGMDRQHGHSLQSARSGA